MQSSLVLLPGEEVRAMVKGELFSVYTNCFANFMSKIVQFFLFLQGIRKEAQLIVTNRRVVLESMYFTCCCIPTSAFFKSIPYSGVCSVEYGFAAVCCCGLCRKYLLTVTQQSGPGFGFVIKGGEAEASGIANVIIQHM